MNWIMKIWVVILVAFLGLSCTRSRDIYVSPEGSDDNAGTRESPVATLFRARDLVREIRKEHPEWSVIVYLRGGTYSLYETFRLHSQDSGSEDHPVVYAACPGEEVHLTGGIRIAPEHVVAIEDEQIRKLFRPEVRNSVRMVDLRSLGINNYGKIRNVGFSRPYGPVWMEVFINGKPLHLSRWPNEGYLPMGKVLDRGSVPRDGDFSNRGGRFMYEGHRPSHWGHSHDVWLMGYFYHGWAEDAVKLKEIDMLHSVFSTAGPSLYGFGPASEKPYRRWYAFNIMEETDMPGEYYIDREAGILYFIPPEELKMLEVSLLETPMVSLLGASNVVFRDIVFECSRGMGIYMDNTRNNRIERCTFRNLGIVGVCIGKGIKPFKQLRHDGTGVPASEVIGSLQQHIYRNTTFDREGGKNNGVISCVIYQTGAGGVSLGGGNRLTLDTAGNFVENCSIHDFNRIEKSYRPGIYISGVSNRISHCEIFNAPSSAILLHGNDHLIEYNEIHHVCLTVDDQGALYYGRDPSERGHKVRYNYFHDNGTKHRYDKKYHGTSSVYHDDGACGMEVYGNIFYKAGTRNSLIGGGADNPYTNNVFMDCQIAIHVDNRNERGNSISPGGIFERRLKAVNYNQPPYSIRYPHLASYFDDNPGLPKRNTVSKNVFYKVEKVINGNPDWLPFKDDNWVTGEDPGFTDYNNKDFSLRKGAKVFDKIPGFKPIPFYEIGIRKDEQ